MISVLYSDSWSGMKAFQRYSELATHIAIHCALFCA